MTTEPTPTPERFSRPGRSGGLSRLTPGLRKGAPPAAVILLVIIAALSRFLQPTAPSGPKHKQPGTLPSAAPTSTSRLISIDDAIRDHRSDVTVESSGVVVKVLPDDQEGDQHQRFLVKLASGSTVLIAHNIDLASRVPARERETVEFHGPFEYNDKGGTVHWTHHDPAGRHEGGWIKLAGKLYD